MTVQIAAQAKRDIARILDWSAEVFGTAARARYERLLTRGFGAIGNADPLGSRDAPELGAGVRLYHLRGSRSGDDRSPVARPRHFLVYRRTK